MSSCSRVGGQDNAFAYRELFANMEVDVFNVNAQKTFFGLCVCVCVFSLSLVERIEIGYFGYSWF